MNKFFKQLIIFCAIMALLTWLLPATKTLILHKYVWQIYIFFVGLTILTYYIATRSIKGMVESKVYVIMAAMGAHLIFSLIFVAVFIFTKARGDVEFALTFYSFYLLFTVFVVRGLLTTLQPN